MKRTLCAVIVLILVFAMGISTSAEGNETELLSELSDEGCISFLEENGIQIPSIYEDESECIPFVRTVIQQIETSPNAIIRCKNYMLLRFALDIKVAVDAYYSNTEATTYATSTSSSLLEDNVMYVTWKDEYQYFNCYGYAIGKSEWLWPGFSTWVSDGYSLETYDYDGSVSMPTIADWVEMDLEYYGYTVTEVSATMLDTQVSDHTRLICIRKDLDPLYFINEDGILEINYDFHLMKLDDDGYWYHKPGYTNPLRYKYVPTNENPWVSEGYNGLDKVYFRYENTEYESEIYYIEYTIPDDWAWEYCGDGQHIQTCSVCGDTKGSALACVYKNGSATCSICGNLDDYIGLNRNKLLLLKAE